MSVETPHQAEGLLAPSWRRGNIWLVSATGNGRGLSQISPWVYQVPQGSILLPASKINTSWRWRNIRLVNATENGQGLSRIFPWVYQIPQGLIPLPALKNLFVQLRFFLTGDSHNGGFKIRLTPHSLYSISSIYPISIFVVLIQATRDSTQVSRGLSFSYIRGHKQY